MQYLSMQDIHSSKEKICAVKRTEIISCLYSKGMNRKKLKMYIKSVGKRFNIEVLIHGEKVEKL